MILQYVLRIVMSWTSLSCKTDTKKRVKALQKEDEGQDDVLNRALDALEGQDTPEKPVGEKPIGGMGPPVRDKKTVEKLDELTELMKDMDVVSNNQRVLTRIDDLETNLKTHFERELGR